MKWPWSKPEPVVSEVAPLPKPPSKPRKPRGPSEELKLLQRLSDGIVKLTEVEIRVGRRIDALSERLTALMKLMAHVDSNVSAQMGHLIDQRAQVLDQRDSAYETMRALSVCLYSAYCGEAPTPKAICPWCQRTGTLKHTTGMSECERCGWAKHFDKERKVWYDGQPWKKGGLMDKLRCARLYESDGEPDSASPLEMEKPGE